MGKADQRPAASLQPSSPADVSGSVDLNDGGRLTNRKAHAFLRLAVPVLIVTVTFLVFIPALDAGFVNWDDDDLLLANTRYQQLGGGNLTWMFTTSYSGHFQPLTWLSYWLDYTIWGRNAFGLHLTNVTLHALTAVGFYFLTRRLLAIGRREHQRITSLPYVASAALGALFFAVHPLRVESVAWLAERRDVLSGFFYVLTVVCYLRYARSERAGPTFPRGDHDDSGRWLFYSLALACCVFSLLAKAAAVTLPIVLLILDAYPLRRSRAIGGVAHGRGWVRLCVEKGPFFVVCAGAGIRAIIAQQQQGALHSLADHGLVARLAQSCHGLAFYITKTLLPTKLGPLYEIPAREVLMGSALWWSAAVIVICVGLAVGLLRRVPAVAAALAVYLAILAPVLGLVQSGPQLVADRYSYLSCLGFAVLVGGGFLHLWVGQSWMRNASARALLVLAVSGVFAMSAVATFRQADIWATPFDLWRHGVRVSPDSSIAHVNFGDALARRQFYRSAMAQYDQGLALNPRDPVALHHMGDACRITGDSRRAIDFYVQALRIEPSRRGAAFSLARSLRDVGRSGDALRVLGDALKRHPNDLEMMEYLARQLSTHPDESIRDGGRAVELASVVNARSSANDFRALGTLAGALAEAGRFDEAVRTAERALALADVGRADLVIRKLQYQLSLYRDQKPYHTPH